MKVGTDAVLLGAWVNIHKAMHMLDIGTGSGTIALMLAQRSGELAEIDAVEIEEADALQADENFNNSPWAQKIHLHHTSIQNFFPEKKYDLIISNPPYFINSQSPPDSKRHLARHTISLSYQDLINSVVRLLTKGGRFNVILPFTEGLQFIDQAAKATLHCRRQYSFKTREEKKIERWLLEFSQEKSELQTGEVTLYKEGEVWSDSYVALTRDFYLKL